ncbi:hypothetical protein V492_03032, partial [Pseudogymnoascus sp. VKM F-4246]
HEESLDARSAAERETIVTQEIPIRVLSPEGVEGIHEPKVRDSDVHILLPPLLQLKAISDRFTKLAFATTTSTAAAVNSTANTPKLELSANMHGSLKLRITTDALGIESVWGDLTNPDLEPNQIEGEVDDLPTEKMRAAGPEAWATVRIDGKDWSRVLSVGRLGGKVIACFVDNHALILYVYLANYEDPGAKESVLTSICGTKELGTMDGLAYGLSGFEVNLGVVAPKRMIEDVDPADRNAVKRIRLQTFHSGATIDECFKSYLKHKDVEPAVKYLMDRHEQKEIVRFKKHIEAAAAKTIYEAAGVPEPSPDDKTKKPLWNFSDVMDLEEDEVATPPWSGHDMIRKQSQERSNVMKSFLHAIPGPPRATDIFGRDTLKLQVQQKSLHDETTAAAFKAQAIMSAVFNKNRTKNMQRVPNSKFILFENSNPPDFPKVDHESVDRFGNVASKFTEAFPATTLKKKITGPTMRLKRPAGDGSSKIRIISVSASPFWSGKNGIHKIPDKTVRSIQLSTLSPEEVHLGDYYSHKFCSVAPHQFARFPELPLHVQDLIWEFSFEPRVVEIQYDPKFSRIWSPTKWPAQSLACKESNFVMRRIYERSPFGEATARSGLLFNFDIDVLFLTFEKKPNSSYPTGEYMPLRVVGQLKVAASFLRSLPPAQLPRVRHLGLDLSLWKKIDYDLSQMRRRRHKPHGRDKYILPMLTGLSSLRIIENPNVGVWRINRGMGCLVAACEYMDARQCSAEDLGLHDNEIRSDVGELLVDRLVQFNNLNPPWWIGSAVMCMARVPM